MEFSRQEYCSRLPWPLPGDLPNPGIKPRSSTMQADSLPSEPWGKPKNTGVVSLSLLQENFPTQGLNWGLLHSRRILYQLSYPGSQASAYLDTNNPTKMITHGLYFFVYDNFLGTIWNIFPIFPIIFIEYLFFKAYVLFTEKYIFKCGLINTFVYYCLYYKNFLS